MLDAFKAIKTYFHPIQPGVRSGDGKILYREIQAHGPAEDFVYCFWQLKTKERMAAPFVYRVVSDGCIDIFFHHGRLAECFVMGFCRKYTEFPLDRDFDYIGIRFFPAAFPLLFGINARELSNESRPLSEVLPDFATWIEETCKPDLSFPEIAALIQAKLNEAIRQTSFDFDARFFNALQLIFQHKGCIEVEEGLDTGLSPRQLRRIFNYYVGTTPKAFCNVLRFQQVLQAKPSRQSLKDNKLYLDLDFFDQAHFIKSFKRFYGATPSQAFS